MAKQSQFEGNIPYFFTIINEAMSADPKSNRHLIEAVTDKKITMKNIQRYRNGDSVPEFSTAKIILQHLRIKIPDADLDAILQESRIYSKNKRDKDKDIKIKKYVEISGNSFDLGDEINPQYIIEFIYNRIESIYGDDKSSFNSYIRDLITRDIKDDILRKDENYE